MSRADYLRELRERKEANGGVVPEPLTDALRCPSLGVGRAPPSGCVVAGCQVPLTDGSACLFHVTCPSAGPVRFGEQRFGWHREAACLSGDPDSWFPSKGQQPVGRDVCRRCPVSAECLGAGMAEYFGVWGGLTEKQRGPLVAAIRRRAQVAA